MKPIDKYRDKKIAIIGYGSEGRQLADFFSNQGIGADVLDQRDLSAEIFPSGIRPVSGGGYLEKLEKYEIIFRSPGVNPSQPQFERSLASGRKITSLTNLFFELCPCPIVGVTGTKGKGTTAALITEIFRASGKEVFFGGNVGNPPLVFLPKLDANCLVVLELSSFQLIDVHHSPHFAVVLNVTADHLDYHRDIAEYRSAKSPIVRYQNPGDISVFDADDQGSRDMARLTSGKRYWFSLEKITEPGAYFARGQLRLNISGSDRVICSATDLQLPGRHNLANALAAIALAGAAGVQDGDIAAAVKSFRGQPHHRLEKVGKFSGILYVNDSAATMPDASIAALDSFSEPKVIILGGSDKGADYQILANRIASGRDIRGVILIGPVAGKIGSALDLAGYSGQRKTGMSDMAEVVSAAREIAREGDIVLLSPASASFGMFKSYQDRGEQFMKEAKKIGSGVKS